MKNLVLIADAFPYSNREPYLETEFKFYQDKFDKIFICSLIYSDHELNKKRELNNENCNILAITKLGSLKYFINVFSTLGTKCLWNAISELYKTKRLNFKTIKQLLISVSRSHVEAKRISKWLFLNGLTSKSEGAFYSYRFDFQPYISLLLRRQFPKMITVARGHRYDLYEELRENKYIPYRRYLLDNLDRIVMISEDGVDYLSNKYPHHCKNVILSRLGTLDFGLGPIPISMNPLRIVSCSTIIDVKRVHLIVEALSQIKDTVIFWDHFGEGNKGEEVKEIAQNILGPNIHYEFKGFIDNPSLMKIYKTNSYHAFINVSSSEGVPVSIMEALSFGLPVIATDAGGTKEIVKDKYNGYLLKNNLNSQDLAIVLRDLANMNMQGYEKLRINARQSWDNESNAHKLYPEFIDKVLLYKNTSK